MDILTMFFLYIVFTVLVAIWANNLGRSVGLAILGCIIFSPLIVAVYYLIVGSVNKCPFCKSNIPKDATACSHCGREVTQHKE